jgi:hypothetical protein
VVAAGFVLLGVVRREIDGGDALTPQGVARSMANLRAAGRRMVRYCSPGEGYAYQRPLCDASMVGSAQAAERVAFGFRPSGRDAVIEADFEGSGSYLPRLLSC